MLSGASATEVAISLSQKCWEAGLLEWLGADSRCHQTQPNSQQFSQGPIHSWGGTLLLMDEQRPRVSSLWYYYLVASGARYSLAKTWPLLSIPVAERPL